MRISLKRGFDIVCAAAGLVFFGLLLLWIAYPFQPKAVLGKTSGRVRLYGSGV